MRWDSTAGVDEPYAYMRTIACMADRNGERVSRLGALDVGTRHQEHVTRYVVCTSVVQTPNRSRSRTRTKLTGFTSVRRPVYANRASRR